MNWNWQTGIGLEAAYTVVSIGILLFCAKCFKMGAWWRPKTLKDEGINMVGGNAIFGVILSALFAFHGGNTFYSALSCVLFMTFLYPFFLPNFLLEFIEGPHRPTDTSSLGIAANCSLLMLSMCILGVAAWAAAMNAGSAHALQIGIGIGGVATILSLLGTFSAEGLTAGAYSS